MQPIANNLLKKVLTNYTHGKTKERHLYNYECNNELIKSEHHLLTGERNTVEFINEIVLQALLKE